MNRFVVVSPTFNAEYTAQKAILSLAAQSYENWHLIVIDDMSTDRTEMVVKNHFSFLGIYDRLTYIKNDKKLWEVANVLQGLKLCNDDDIVCRFDLDDYLIDANALEIINIQYKADPNLDALWTSHRWFDARGITSMNISGPMANDADPYVHPWVSSHLKTFRKRLVNGIPYENFLNKDGDLVKRAGDQCLYLPVLYKAKKKMYLPIAAYAYRCDMRPQTFQTDDAKFQKAEADFLRERGFIEKGPAWEETFCTA